MDFDVVSLEDCTSQRRCVDRSLLWVHIICNITKHNYHGHIILLYYVHQGNSSKVEIFREEILNYFVQLTPLSKKNFPGDAISNSFFSFATSTTASEYYSLSSSLDRLVLMRGVWLRRFISYALQTSHCKRVLS